MKKAKSHAIDSSYSETHSVRNVLLSKDHQHRDKEGVDIELHSVKEGYRNSSNIQQQFFHQKRKKTTSRIQTVKAKFISHAPLFQNSSVVGKLNEESSSADMKDPSYDVWDLTYTLMSSKIPVTVAGFMFVIFVVIRYYTFACLIYISTQSKDAHILWVLVVIVDRLLYMLLVIKISLQTPETRTERVLKSHWNSKQSDINQLFEVIDTKSLIISIIRGMIPAELAFIYIKAQPRRKFQLYTAINYINASIQAILYYPFFIAYCFILTVDNTFALNYYYKNATIGFAIIAEIMIAIVSIALILVGIKRKYGRIFYCCF